MRKKWHTGPTVLYFILKALFALKMFKILIWIFGDVKGLIRKIKLISNSMTSQPGKQKELQYTNCPICHEVKARR